MHCLSKEEISQFSSLLKEVSQDQRLQIICILHQAKELCVCEIYEKLTIRQNLASHHL
jgi:DNA-binding transcriptional ArsR family regulator